MKRFLLAGILGAASMLAAPITITVIPVLGPNIDSVSFADFATNTINALRATGAPAVGGGQSQYSGLANGATVNAGQFIATETLNFDSWQGVAPGPYAGEKGTSLYFSVIVQESERLNTFSLLNLIGDETYLGTAFGPSFVGGPYRGTAVGVKADGTVLTSGFGGQLVRELFYVGYGFAAQAGAGTGSNQDVINQNVAAIQALVDRTTQVCYSVGQTTSCGSVNIPGAQNPIPEPGTMALLGLGLAGVAFLRRRKA